MTLTTSCTEEIDLGDELKFEDVIVIEATITNEKKIQQILISRTYEFDEEGPSPERDALVNVVLNDGETIRFSEQSPGVYASDIEFSAEPDIDYQLLITTNQGRSYQSSKVQLSNGIPIEKLYASREVNSIGNEILAINVDSFDPLRQSNYYRYEYEETYKIIAPNWVPDDFILVEDEEGNISPNPGLAPRPVEEKECYNTVDSNSIIQTTTTSLTEDRVADFNVRSINTDDAIISHRYSILVKQYVQSIEAYTYYDVLNQLSGSGNALSQIQPGFITTNIVSKEERNEKVLGFFQVSGVSEKRIFVNYSDLFPNEPLPPYFIGCESSAPILVNPAGGTPLKDQIEAGIVKYLDENIPPLPNEGPYLVVSRACGDCTELGTTEKPDFWVD